MLDPQSTQSEPWGKPLLFIWNGGRAGGRLQRAEPGTRDLELGARDSAGKDKLRLLAADTVAQEAGMQLQRLKLSLGRIVGSLGLFLRW